MSNKIPKGSNRLKIALRNAANAIGNLKETHLSDFFKRIAYRKGRTAAVSATARKLAVIIWNMITRKVVYQPPTEYLFLDQKRKAKVIDKIKRNIAKLELKPDDLGFAITWFLKTKLDVSQNVESNIGTFHQKRIHSLNNLNLEDVLKRKNPYLFKAKYVLTAEQIIKGIVDAHISSSEETTFGDWLEGLAIFINQKIYSGWKSGISGIDLEFDNENIRYIVNIKSSPNWGNSAQIKKMIDDFKTAKKTLRTSNSKVNIIAVNGCCYGKDNRPDKGEYFKYCGQRFWEFISNDEHLYTKIIEPIAYKAKEKNDEFVQSYSKMINKFTIQFVKNFCNNDGTINWEDLLRFNSGKDKFNKK